MGVYFAYFSSNVIELQASLSHVFYLLVLPRVGTNHEQTALSSHCYHIDASLSIVVLIAAALHRGFLFLLFRPLNVPVLSFVHCFSFCRCWVDGDDVAMYWTGVNGLRASWCQSRNQRLRGLAFGRRFAFLQSRFAPRVLSLQDRRRSSIRRVLGESFYS